MNAVSEFHIAGADTRIECEPNQRLLRGTWRSFDEEERRPLQENLQYCTDIMHANR